MRKLHRKHYLETVLLQLNPACPAGCTGDIAAQIRLRQDGHRQFQELKLMKARMITTRRIRIVLFENLAEKIGPLGNNGKQDDGGQGHGDRQELAGPDRPRTF